ncbi:2-oxoglutarate (2OG) and Fe(II)-dependent oxygenase superfamilyprotein [Zostera marina]|uniref:2-oxoglutarate (2OG) and Fe(II)-dependent oxygenase superfamilyprotein n=1 Tax=Zostera marina TaxID=29655 RepID=A0A0K9NHV6_ZOSMR|nr:2-oxoglutarate (2OG) and Fe(II)-dependent oxygenase superfamilyprotein [Zostera marina]
MNPSTFFVPEFIKAISDNNEESLRNILSEPHPGLYTFSMLQPFFCDMMVSEVENFEKWVGTVKLKIMRPNTMNKYGVVLDDFGLEPMLDTLMEDFISPLSRALFVEVGGQSLDSHHGFVVEYGNDKDRELGFHVDDSEVTLNVCLGNKFLGGDLFFRGVRCEKHVNSDIQPEEYFDYQHVPGQAILHRGRHRHGALPTTDGYRINMILWCRSSNFREMKKYQKDFSCWCGQCLHEKKERQCLTVDATRLAFLRKDE